LQGLPRLGQVGSAYFPRPKASIFCNDITERKLIPKKLLDRETRLLAAIDHMP
jgi:hypothetical protein